jgi:flagellar motor switch protein FliM
VKTIEGKKNSRLFTTEPKVLPCNFRSAGQLSNESARALTTLHEVLARNLMNSLDVYLGTGLDVRLTRLEQMSMEEFKARRPPAGYLLPCATQPSSAVVLLELENALVFTMIDLLLGGSGATADSDRELTEIDEEIMAGVGTLITQQIEKVWEPVGYSLTHGTCVKPILAHKLFPATEKVLRIQLDVNVAGMTGALFLNVQASLASTLVRNIRAENLSGRGRAGYLPGPGFRKRLLDCRFAVSGELTDLKLSVKDLAGLQRGTIIMLSAPVEVPGTLMLEGTKYFEALPVRQGSNKAMQLREHVQPGGAEMGNTEKELSAD